MNVGFRLILFQIKREVMFVVYLVFVFNRRDIIEEILPSGRLGGDGRLEILCRSSCVHTYL